MFNYVIRIDLFCKSGNLILNFAPLCSFFVDLLPIRIEDRSSIFFNEVEYFALFSFYLMRVWFCHAFF